MFEPCMLRQERSQNHDFVRKLSHPTPVGIVSLTQTQSSVGLIFRRAKSIIHRKPALCKPRHCPPHSRSLPNSENTYTLPTPRNTLNPSFLGSAITSRQSLKSSLTSAKQVPPDSESSGRRNRKDRRRHCNRNNRGDSSSSSCSSNSRF